MLDFAFVLLLSEFRVLGFSGCFLGLQGFSMKVCWVLSYRLFDGFYNGLVVDSKRRR